MKRSFSSLTAQEVLHVAVFIEERNAEVYHRFAEMFAEFRDVDSLEIASVFWDMAAEERNHSTILQERYTELYGNRACAMTEEDVMELIEIPRLEESDVFSGSTSEITPRARALQVALQSEQQAQLFYHEQAQKTSEPAMRRLYQALGGFESDHVNFIERKLIQQKTRET